MAKEEKQIRVWLTNYALTQGIQCVDAKECGDGVIEYRPNGATWGGYAHGEGRDWHRTPEAALARAEMMRLNKIASLKRSLAKLETLQFELPEGVR